MNLIFVELIYFYSLLTGDRPYWWVHESPIFKNKRPPFIHQFPRTCETGPGNPSGHSELNAAVFLVLCSALVSWIKKTDIIK